MKIKGKLRIYTAIISIIPIIILGGVSIWRGTQTLVEAETEVAKVNITRAKEMLNTLLDEAQNDIEMVSVVQENFDNNISLIEKTFENLASKENYSAVYFGNTAGEMFLYPMADRENLSDDYDPRVRPWYEGAVESDADVYVSDPYVDATFGNTIITVSKKIYENGSLSGVVGIDISWENFQEKASKMKIGNKGYIFVMYNDGNTLVHNNKDFIGTKKLMEFDFGKKIVEQKRGDINYKYEGETKFVVFDYIEKAGLIIAGGTTYKDIRSNFDGLRNLILIIVLIILGLSALGIYIFGKDVNSGLDDILKIATNAANGDFAKDTKINRDDEIGDTAIEFKKAMDKQADFLKDIKKKGLNLADISDETNDMSRESMESIKSISESIEGVSAGIETNSSSATEAASGIEEVARSSVTVADLSKSIGEEVEEASKKAQNGQEGIEDIIVAMDKITESIEKASESSEELSNQTEEIRNFVTIIQGISEQTNLLALNAAIEAARAGEAGKGFAVVADEIRKLAEDSQKATEDIERIIDNLVLKSEEVAKETEDGKAQTQKGNEIVQKVGEEFKLIIEGVNSIHNMIDDIVTSSGEQSASTEEMAAVINDISTILEKSEDEVAEVSREVMNEVEFIEKIAKLSERLANMSDDMEEYLSQFNFSDETNISGIKEKK
ncbi:MAG: methyl-accepting chemotaxis protein [Fusobacteriota bacterium]